MHAPPKTLGEILAPVDTKEFVSSSLGANYRYIPGVEGKFAGLLTWSALNHILSSHQLDAPRLRLARDGKTLPPESFIAYRAGGRRSSSRIAKIRSAELTRQLQEGATLIIDAMDEIHEPITDLTTNLERSLGARAQVNLYAGWRTSPGFDLHWDGHDVIILQVSGRKHWKVYPMTREYPLPDDPKAGNPPENPLWEGMLNDGDLLYIPRGWWHVALPVDEPTLHLTVGLHRATGLDFIAWLSDRLRERPIFRQDLPRLGAPSDRQSHLERLRAEWEQMWNAGLLEEYFAYQDARASLRPHFGLPWTANPSVIPPAESGWQVKWLVPRPIECVDDRIVVRGNGREFMFAAAAWPALSMLQETGTCSIENLSSRTERKLSEEQLRSLLIELIEAGLVSIQVNLSQ